VLDRSSGPDQSGWQRRDALRLVSTYVKPAMGFGSTSMSTSAKGSPSW
jgi:hypothetical protein